VPVRTLVVWCPDWPVVAAGHGPGDPAAVVYANRVVACSPAARAEGVRVGLRRREAQARCPALVVLAPDPAGEARSFEAVAAAVATLTPRVEVVVPGTCAIATRGPSRYLGGDEALAARVTEVVDEVLAGRTPCRVGIADGPFAAALAARTARRRPVVVAPGESAAFLEPLPVTALDRPDLADLLQRLGVRTLGDLAALPPADVVARFGSDGALASRLARGLDERPPGGRPPPPELHAAVELDPPAERVDVAAFAAKGLADDLHARLAAAGLACTRLVVEVETEHGEQMARVWRHEGSLTAAAIAERVRWQLEGWIEHGGAGRPTGGLTLLRLVPEEVVPERGRQLGFWGGAAEADERAARAIARVQGLLGPDAVAVPERRGGRGPGERVVLVPAHSVDLTSRRAPPSDPPEPWPGQVPAPSPVLVHADPVPADLVDAAGAPVRVTGRGSSVTVPAWVAVGGGGPEQVVAWAGPWPADERWWDAAARRRRARLQVVTAAGAAHLLALESGRWWVEASYD
jgi:protein ImuB